MKTLRLSQVLVGCLVFLIILMQTAGALSVSVSSPRNGAHFESCASITLQASFDIPEDQVKRIYFYKNGQSVRSIRQAPWEYTIENVPDGIYEFYARITTQDDESAESDSVQVFVGPISDGDKIINGEFSCGLAPWTLSLNGEASAEVILEEEGWLSDEASMVYVDIQNPGTENWHVMLVQSCPIDSGHTYQIYFMAEVEDTKSVGVDFQSTTGDYPVHFWQSVEVTSDEYEYGPVEFYCPVTDHSNQFKLALSANHAGIYLDAIKVIDLNWVKNETSIQHNVTHVENFTLFQNYPNPFNPSTEIAFELPQNENITLSIYNLQGQLVKTLADGLHSAGMHNVMWNGKDNDNLSVPSGIYIYQLKTDSFKSTKRMLLMK